MSTEVDNGWVESTAECCLSSLDRRPEQCLPECFRPPTTQVVAQVGADDARVYTEHCHTRALLQIKIMYLMQQFILL